MPSGRMQQRITFDLLQGIIHEANPIFIKPLFSQTRGTASAFPHFDR
jgi:hypothetical protein